LCVGIAVTPASPGHDHGGFGASDPQSSVIMMELVVVLGPSTLTDHELGLGRCGPLGGRS
jgi:hypothetical protein